MVESALNHTYCAAAFGDLYASLLYQVEASFFIYADGNGNNERKEHTHALLVPQHDAQIVH